LGIERARALGPEARGGLPLTTAPIRARAEHGRPSEDLGAPQHLGLPRSSAALQAAYRRGSHDPVQIAERALAAGCIGYISKPINTRTFADEVRGYLLAKA